MAVTAIATATIEPSHTMATTMSMILTRATPAAMHLKVSVLDLGAGSVR